MKKDAPLEWDEDCQYAFESIKTYLTKPPILSSPIKGKPLVCTLLFLKALLVLCWPNKMKLGRKTPSITLAELW